MNPDPVKAFIREIESHSYSIGRYEVFTDFVECFSISLRQPYLHDPKLEENYLGIFNSQEAYKALFPQLMNHTVDGLERKPCDFLGEAFMRLNLGNSARGQFFTPYDLSLMIAKMTFHQTEKGLITEVADPACGAGGMLIAGAEVLKAQYFNIHERLFVLGQDIDRTACNMCYIQLSLLGIPGAVIWGDTLRMNIREQWLTPFFFYKPFQERYRLQKTLKDMRSILNGFEESERSPLDAVEVPAGAEIHFEEFEQLNFNFN